MLQDPEIYGLLKNFQDSIFAQKIDKRRRTEAYSYIGARMSESDWLEDNPSLSMFRLAAKLAWEGHLPSVKKMKLSYRDLISDIPCVKLGKLASIVTDVVMIYSIDPASLDIVLESVRCSLLGLVNMTLTEPQTRALVTALTERLERLTLSSGLTVDIETLCQYDGQGRCQRLGAWRDTRRMYGERLRRWGEEVGWAVTTDDNDWLIIQRK